MQPAVLAELRLRASANLGSLSLLTTALAGDRRLADEFLPWPTACLAIDRLGAKRALMPGSRRTRDCHMLHAGFRPLMAEGDHVEWLARMFRSLCSTLPAASRRPLWGVRMVQTGVQRAYGAQLRTTLGSPFAGPPKRRSSPTASQMCRVGSNAAGLHII
jgi:hypothetical protein